jgi:hypothetical protein
MHIPRREIGKEGRWEGGKVVKKVKVDKEDKKNGEKER